MGQLEERVRELILARYRSLAAFARSVNIPEHTLYSVLNNGLSGASLTTAMPIVKALGLKPEAIAEGQLIPLSIKQEAVPVPLLGSISAGQTYDAEHAEDFFPIPADLSAAYPKAFMLRVAGNSMNRILPDGFLALVNPQDVVGNSGKLFAVAVGESAVVVRYVVLHDNGLTLMPDSFDPTYRPVLFDFGIPDTESVTIIGRVVWYCPPTDWNTRTTSPARIAVTR